MARIRTIKPEFFTSEDILDLSPLARLLYIGIWCEADREGRLAWKPKTLKTRYLPVDNADVHELCRELTERGLVIPYGDGFAYIPSFLKHQHINPREAKSLFPDPLECPSFDASNLDLHASSRVTDASVTRREEGKGKERKGKEGEGTRVATREEEISLPSEEIQKPKPESQEPLPDRLVADNDAKRIADKYRRMIAPTSTPGNGQTELVKLIVDQRIPAEDLEQSVKNFAAWRAAIPKPPFPIHARTFFGGGEWLNFRDCVPEQIQPPDPHAAEKAEREAKDAEMRKKLEIVTAREIEELNARAAERRKAKAQLAGG